VRSRRPRRRFAFSLRTKLLALSLALLVIPWTGYQYVTQMERFLRAAQEQALLTTARSIARVLGQQPELLGAHSAEGGETGHLYVRVLSTPLQLDGYGEDWEPYRAHTRLYGEGHVLSGAADYDPDTLSVQQTVGTRDGYFYALFEVRDERIVYRLPGESRPEASDHLRLRLGATDGDEREYLFTTAAPGWVTVHARRGDGLVEETRIKAEWQETTGGYTIELRIPLSLLGSHLGFSVVDVDGPRRQIRTAVGTRQPETITVASPAMQALLHGAEPDAGRVWVVDREGRVLASAGDLRTGAELTAAGERRSLGAGVLHLLYGLVLDRPADAFEDELSDVSQLDSGEVRQALSGMPATRWRRTPDGQAAVFSAAQPVHSEGHLRGAVVVEQTSHQILLLQNRALEHIFNSTLLVFLAAAVLLLLLATRLAGRLRRLRDEAEQSISADGRVVGRITPSTDGDELGDLSRSFAALLDRLGQYTRYLESMAGKLSHELRTPLIVVRSSLDNLEDTEVSDDARVYSQRARDGLARLEDILARMSEATRLEQALQRSEHERFDLTDLIRGCVAGYRGAYPEQNFALNVPTAPLPMVGVPDLIAQMLDKLVSNAVDFARAGTAIHIAVQDKAAQASLRVANEGPPLPDSMKHNLFDSMVSVRPAKGREPHLGLGLYIVRLVAEFHGGRVRAQTVTSPPGVEFVIDLPLPQK